MEIGLRTRDVDVEILVGDVEEQRLRGGLPSCQHFFVDSELERATQSIQLRIGNSQGNNRERETWSVFQQFEMCSKSESGFSFQFEKYLEDGGFKSFYAHVNNTLLDWSKFVCTRDDLAKLKDNLDKSNVIESCSKERLSTKWSFYKLTKLTVFADLLKDVPMGCKEAALPEPLERNGTINCLTFEENTRQPYNDNLCLFRALALFVHGNQRMEEETSKFFNSYINKMYGLSADQFQGVHMNDIPSVADLLILNIVLCDIDNVDGNIIGDLARRSVQKYKYTVRLIRYNKHICYVNNLNEQLRENFQFFRCPICDSFFNRTFNLEQHLSLCSERVKDVYPGNVYQTQEFLFDNLDSFAHTLMGRHFSRTYL